MGDKSKVFMELQEWLTGQKRREKAPQQTTVAFDIYVRIGVCLRYQECNNPTDS
jgi:hypothetical protein